MASNGGVNERFWKRHGCWRSESAKDGYVVDSADKRLSVSQILGLLNALLLQFLFFETLLGELVLNYLVHTLF